MTNSTHNENSIGWQNPFTENIDNEIFEFIKLELSKS